MNHVYRIVWNESLGSFVAVAELAPARGKPSGVRRGRQGARWAPVVPPWRLLPLVASLARALLLGLAVLGSAHAEPRGGQVSAGSGSINQAGSVTTVQQTSPRLAINWQSFDIGAGEKVQFIQPSASAIALNRVLGTDGSRILGQLQANGQVFLINPNGILFGRSAQVDVGGLVASTLNLTDDDFLAGRFSFSGAGGSVRNEGRLNALGDGRSGGSIALLGSQVINTGDITADRGSVALAAGRRITLDFAGDGLLKLSVDEGTLNALVDNGGLVRADGGSVLLTARAADALRATVVNNTGLVQARTLENKAGVIKLLGGLDEATGGTVTVNGKLDASAPNGGDGGFIEASAYNVRVLDGTQATTLAPFGKAGEFLIDPSDFTISAGAGPSTGSGIGNLTLQGLLAGGNFTAATTDTGTDAGNLIVDGAVTWTSANTLKLQSRFGAGGIQINQPLSFANGTLQLDATGTITASAAVSGNIFDLQSGTWRQVDSSLPSFAASDFRSSGGTFIRALGGDGSGGSPYQLADVYGLQGMGSGGMLGLAYRLANDIDASGTVNWNAGAGWRPVGTNGTEFTGSFDGLGRSISGLTINRPSSFAAGVGLFGATREATLRNVGLLGGAVTGGTTVGALVGFANRGSISNVQSTGTVNGSSIVGGLVGLMNIGSITDGRASGAISGGSQVGGLVGSGSGSITSSEAVGAVTASGGTGGGLVGTWSLGSITSSHATGAVSGGSALGGLVGYVTSSSANISGSYATGTVTASGDRAGGLVGDMNGRVTGSYASGAVFGANKVGGLVGSNNATITNTYATGAVTGTSQVGGLMGYQSGGAVSTSYAAGTVTGSSSVGGLLGQLALGGGTVTTSFWNRDTTGQANGVGIIIGDGSRFSASGKTSAEMQAASTFTAAGWNLSAVGGDGSTWRIYEGNTAPLLRSFMTALTPTPTYDGSGTLLANSASISLPAGTDASRIFGTATSSTLTLRGGAAGGYTAEADASGLYSNQLGYDLSRTATRTIATPGSAAGDITLPNGAAWTNGTLAINTTGNITAAGAIAGGAGSIFDLQAGTWRQVNTTLPGFAVRDFRSSGGTFIRALGGDGSGGSPYQLADVYGLQGMGSGGMLGLAYRLANDIDASGTVNWNAGAGWRPVGVDFGATFTGSLDGNGRSVSGLTINRPSSSNVGLFGVMSRSSSLSNIRLDAVSVLGGDQTGAAAGYASGTLNGVRVSGSVRGTSGVGGVVGLLTATSGGNITATGLVNEAAVTGSSSSVGGIAGSTSSASISLSYNTGTVSAARDSVGGIVGSQTGGVLERVFNTGNVAGSGNIVGGLVGALQSGPGGGAIRDAYNTGEVRNAGVDYVGGAVGLVLGGSLQRVYNTGAVSLSGGGLNVGGLVGFSQSASITASFWDPNSSGQSASSGGGTAKTAAELKTLSTFTGAGWTNIDDAGGTGNTWRIYGGNTTPLLRDFMTALTPTPTYDGSGTLLANIASISLPAGTDASRIFGTATSSTLTLRGGAAGGYTAEVATSGLYSNQLGYDIGNATRTIATPGSAAGDITLPNGVAWTNGTLAINTTGNITAAGAIAGGAGSIFDLQAGTWRQVNTTLPGFAVRDFRLSGGTFIRALGGDGSGGSPYQLADVYGLQGMGSGGMLGLAYRLANDIDASGTVNWNAGAGWAPVGTSGTAFTGSFDGLGRSISGLTINRPSSLYVGLFGGTSGATLRNVGLLGGAVTGSQFVGSLVGQANSGTFSNVQSTGTVNGSQNVGGLVGVMSAGSITDGRASGAISGRSQVGGLVGSGGGSITSSEAVGAVTASSVIVGGLVGEWGSGSITSSHATGAVSGGSLVGGLIGSGGSSNANISGSYATGTVTASGDQAGGLVGNMNGAVTGSYASGAVLGANRVGGLVGNNSAAITNSYATGAVTGTSQVGGLMGYQSGGAVSTSYATGTVTGSSSVGGLLGQLGPGQGTVTTSFWNLDTTGQANGAGNNPFAGRFSASGKTSAEMQAASTFTAAGWNLSAVGGDGSTWRIYEGNTAPLLRSFMTALTPTPTYDGSGTLLANIASISLPAGTDASRIFGTATSSTLTLRGGAAGGYTAEVATSGLYSNQLGYDIGNATRTIATPGSAAGDITLPNGVAWTNGTLAINTTGNITAAGAIAGGAGSIFDLQAGTWRQVNTTLPGFAVRDFRSSGGTFIRALGGDGSGGSPYQLADIYGLQGVGSTGNLGFNYTLANNIDASGTANWNSNGAATPTYAGFTPLGNNSTSFTGTFDGLGQTVTGLTINRGDRNVGLFGKINNATLRNVGLVGGSVRGGNVVGSLVGLSTNGSISNAYATGSVTGTENVGGLVGGQDAGSSISNAYATGSVTGTGRYVGGLVSASVNNSNISNVYATGRVTGTSYVGGLVGFHSGGSINNAYATGSVSGANGTIGGLVGQLEGGSSISNAYATGSVTGNNQVGGLVGFSNSSISNAYATGSVTGNSDVGGLVGFLFGGSISNSYYSQTTNQSDTGKGERKTTAEMQQFSTFAGWDVDAQGGTNKVWRIYENQTAPLLRSFLTQLNLTPDYDGSGAAQANIGSVSTPAGADSSKILGTQTNNSLTLTSPNANGYVATANTTGLYSNQQGYDLVSRKEIATTGSAAGEIRLADGVNWTNGTLNINGNVTNAGAINNSNGIFNLLGGTWSQTGSNNAAFSVKDFRISGGSFVRALGGDGSTGTPYQLSDVYGLQGMGSTTLLGSSFQLANAIDASGTANWNAGLGWKPVGDGTTAFTGGLDGRGFTITGLAIARPTENNVGLIGRMAGSASLANLRLNGLAVRGSLDVGGAVGLIDSAAATLDGLQTSGTVTGDTEVGGLVGNSAGTIRGSRNAATVTGTSLVGGIAGAAGGLIDGSSNTGGVSGVGFIGGIAGAAIATVSNVYNTGVVTGNQLVGGLVGSMASTTSLQTSFNSGEVRATGATPNSLGGLAGQGLGTLRDAYSTGAVVGADAGNVGGAIGIADSGMSLSRVYSTGAVSSTGTGVGGLVGAVSAGPLVSTTSFWDPNTSGQLTSAVGVSKTTAELKTLATFTGAGWTNIDDAGGTANAWRIYDSNTTPLLRGFMTGLNLAAGNQVRAYDATTATLSASLPADGLVLGTGASGKNVGSYQTKYFSGQLGYDITQAVLTINPAVVSLSGQRVYDAGTTIAASVLVATGTVGGETLTVTGSGSIGSKDVGTGKPVSLGSLALADGTGGSGGLASNYSLVGGSYRVDITTKAVTVSGITAANKVYDATPTATLDTTAATANGLIAGDTVSFSAAAATGSFADKNVGTAKAVTVTGAALSGTAASNYTLAQQSGLAADITAKAVTVSGITAASKVYDATPVATLDATAATANGLIAGDAVSFSAAAATGSFADKNVGAAKAVTVTGAALSGTAAGNYMLTQQSGLAADITAKAVTVSGITAANKVYDATPVATLDTAAATANGLIAGDTVSFSAAAATGSFADKNVGTAKAVTVTGAALSGTAAGNYTLTQQSGLAANVTARAVTVSGITAANKVYDATPVAALDATAATANGLIAGDAVSFSAAAATGSFADKNVGTARAVTVSGTSLSGTDANNYTLAQQSGLAADITAKAVTVSGITAANKVYDATPAATLDTTAATANGLIAGDTVSFSAAGATGAFADKNVGTAKAVTVTGAALSGTAASNYTLTQQSGLVADITAKAVTVSGITAASKVYDATPVATLNATAATANGLIAGDAVSFSAAAATGSFADKNVGTAKAVTVTGAALSGTAASNYTLTQQSGLAANITAKAVTVSGITAANKVYDATPVAALDTAAATANGLIAGDTVSFSAAAATGSFADKNVGTAKAVTVTGAALSGTAAGNYTLTQQSGLAADITAKVVTVSGITAANKVYDATPVAALDATAATANGLIAGDAVSFSAAAATGSFADKNVGTARAVTVSGTSLSGTDANNYTLAQQSGLAADITAKVVTVSGITAANKVYDATPGAALDTTAATANGLIAGDTVSFSAAAATGSFADKNVGTAKAVTVTGAALSGTAAGNYTLAQQSGLAADITAKAVTVSGITAANKVYDATPVAALDTAAATANGLIAGDTVSFSATAATGSFADKNVGTAKAVTVTGAALSGTAAGNYTLTQQSGLVADITAKAVTVSGITAANKVYDATPVAALNTTSATANGLIAGDTVSFSAAGASGSFVDRNVGTAKPVTVTGAALSGTAASNYTLAQQSGLAADITAKVVTVSGITAANKVYDATPGAALDTTAATANGLIAGDAVSFSAAAATGSFADKNVGTARAVTVSGTSLSGTDANNYTLAQQSGLAADITAKAVTVSGITAANKVYDATPAATLDTTAATANGLIAGDTVSFSAAGATGAFADKNVGTAKAVTVTGAALSGTAASNYTLTQQSGLVADITAKAVTVSGITAANKVYDATPVATLNATAATANGLIAGDAVTFSAAAATGSFADKNVGTAKAVTVTGAALSGTAAGNYTLTQQSGLAANITAKAVTVSGITAANKVYDATPSAALDTTSATANGLIAGDTVSFSAAGATGAFADKNVGTAKAVTVTGAALSGTDASNYTLAQQSGLAADINAKAVTVSGITAANKVYDATPAAALDTTAATANGLIAGDTVSFSAAAATGAFADKNVGTAKPVTVSGTSLSGTAAGNYTLTQQTGLAADITAKAVTVSGITAANKVYDATPAAVLDTTAATANGLIAGDAVSFSAAAATGSFADKNVGTAKAVTVTGAALSGTAAGNYTLTQQSGLAADITAKAVTVSGITAANKVYDATPAAALDTTSATANGLIAGDTVSFSAAGATGAFADKNVGTAKAVTVTGAALSGTAASNYTLAQQSGLAADINAKAVTVSGITAANKVYDATPAAALDTTAATANGLIAGDAVSFSAAAATGAFADKNVGTAKAVTVTGAALSGTAAGNYTLTQQSGLAADITAKAVTVSGITAANKVYDATPAAALDTTAATANGLIAGDTVSFSAAGATGAFADKNVGTAKAVTVTGAALSGTAASNYTLAQQSGLAADINAKAVTVSGITAANKVYDATPAAALDTTAATANGLIAGDTVSFSAAAATGAFADKNVGTAKPVTVSGTSLSGTAAGNYTLTQQTGLAADITAKAVTVSGITAANKVYDATPAAALDTTAATANGLIAGDAVSFSAAAATGSFADKNVGTAKAVTVTGAALSGTAASNYTLAQQSGLAADITAKAVTVSGITAASKVYDATPVATLDATAATANGLIAGDAVSFSAAAATGSFADKNVGTAKLVTVTGAALSGTAAGNYTLTQQSGLAADINAKAVTVSGITAANKVYDATPAAALDTTAATANGLIAGDAVSFSAAAATGSFADKNVGTAKLVTVTGAALSGTDASNYTLAQQSGLAADINAKAVTVSGITAANKVYDATPTAALDTTAATANGLIAGDAVSFSAAAATGSFADKNVGTAKAVTVTGAALSGTAAGNYTLTQQSGLAADITAKAVTVSGITAANKVYDATPAAALDTTAATANGLIAGDAVSFSAAAATGSFADKNVGTAKAVTVTGAALSGTAAGNYMLTQQSGLAADITAKAVTVSGITAANKVYDATPSAALDTTSATANGLIAGDTVSFSAAGATGAFADKNVGTAKAVTVTGAALSGTAASNYTLAQQSGLAADITAKAVTVSGITAASKVYDATPVATLDATAATAHGLIAGDAVSFSAAAATGSFADKNVGTAKAVTVTGAALSGTAAGNYTLTQQSGLAANITAKAVTVSGITAANKVYDATPVATLDATAATANGLIAGDAVSFSAAAATGAFADKNVGTAKAVTVTGAALSGTAAGNYTLAQQSGLAADITAKAVTVSGITTASKVYDATPAAALDTTAATANGLIAGDTVSFSAAGATGAFADKNVGNAKAVTVSGAALSGTAASNYTLAQQSGLAADITAKAVTVSGITAASKAYDATPVAALDTTAATANGLIAGDTVSFSAAGATGAFADKNVGTAKAVTVSGASLSGTAASNYTLAQQSGLAADITAKAVTVSGITAASKVYDATPVAALDTTAATANGLIAGDTVSFSAAGATGVFADKNVGTAKAVTVTGAALSGTAASNYTLTQQTGLAADITAKAVTVSGIAAEDKVYDGTLTARLLTAGANVIGLLGGDRVGVDTTAATGRFDDKHVGQSKPVAVNGLTLNGSDAGNYSVLSPLVLQASIRPAPLHVAADNQVKLFGSPDPFLSFSVGGAVPGDDPRSLLAGSLTRDVGESGGTYDITQGTLVTANADYAMSFTGGTLRILPLVLSAAAPAAVAVRPVQGWSISSLIIPHRERALEAVNVAPGSPASMPEVRIVDGGIHMPRPWGSDSPVSR